MSLVTWDEFCTGKDVRPEDLGPAPRTATECAALDAREKAAGTSREVFTELIKRAGPCPSCNERAWAITDLVPLLPIGYCTYCYLVPHIFEGRSGGMERVGADGEASFRKRLTERLGYKSPRLCCQIGETYQGPNRPDQKAAFRAGNQSGKVTAIEDKGFCTICHVDKWYRRLTATASSCQCGRLVEERQGLWHSKVPDDPAKVWTREQCNQVAAALERPVTIKRVDPAMKVLTSAQCEVKYGGCQCGGPAGHVPNGVHCRK